MECLAPHPDDRPPSGAEVARRLSLCLKPQVRELLAIEPGTWRHSALRRPYLWALTAGLAPNIVAGWFNYQYNKHAIVKQLDRSSQEVFVDLSTIINAIAFPLGGFLGILLVWRLARFLRRRTTCTPQELARARKYSLTIGFHASLIGLVEWFAAGPIFPYGFRLLGGDVPADAWMHFFASMALSGLIAAAYPYFFITRLGTRVFLPALVGSGELGDAARKECERTATTSHVFLAMAALIPMLSIMLASFSGAGERIVLGILSLVAMIGFVLAFWLYRGIQRDVSHLREVVA
jgi:hypothetical protein